MTGPQMAGSQTETFDCPRCGESLTERFWGPCGSCRATLVEAYHAESSAGSSSAPSEESRFEPAMHVVPNHVATKD